MDIQIPELKVLTDRLKDLETTLAKLDQPTGTNLITASTLEKDYAISSGTRKNRTLDGTFEKFKLGARIFYDRTQVENAIRNNKI